MEESLRAAARIIADYEGGITPDDPLAFSACYQLAAAIRPQLPSPDAVLLMEEYVAAITDILTELAKHDLVMVSLIQTLAGDKPSPPPHAHYTPTAFSVSQAQTIVQGDQYNLSGDFRGAVVNIASTLESTVQQAQVAGGNPPELLETVDQLLNSRP